MPIDVMTSKGCNNKIQYTYFFINIIMSVFAFYYRLATTVFTYIVCDHIIFSFFFIHLSLDERKRKFWNIQLCCSRKHSPNKLSWRSVVWCVGVMCCGNAVMAMVMAVVMQCYVTTLFYIQWVPQCNCNW